MLENIRLALRGISTHKLRSFLTMLGVIIGIASIIGIVSIVEGTNARLEKSLIGSGNNVTTVALSDGGYEYSMSSGIPAGVNVVSDASMDAIRNIDGVVNAATYRQRDMWDANVYRQNTKIQTGKLLGISKDFLDTLQYTVIQGRPFSENEFSKGKKVALIDTGAAEILFEGEDPLGKPIEIQSEPFIVVGVTKDLNKEDTEYESAEDYYRALGTGNLANVYIPEESWQLIFQYDEPQNVALHAETTGKMTSVGNKAADILNSANPSATVSYASLSSAENESDMKTLTDSIQLMLICVASLSLIVGGIGVMNIMLVSVTERTAEIGLKKALGAKRRTIMLQFLTESAVLTTVGGFIGVLVGIGLALIISFAASLDFAVSVPWIIIAVLFSILIGVVFGGWPASRAAKLNPIDALRRE